MIERQIPRIQRSDGKVQRSDGRWYTPKKKYIGSRKYNPGAAGADNTKTAELSTGSKKAFLLFIAKYNEGWHHKIGYNIHDYQAVIKELNDFYINKALETADLILLPNSLGKIGVKKFKRALKIKPNGYPNLPIDWNEYYKTGNITYFTNEHTNGNSFRWVWMKPDLNKGMSNPTMYRFKTVKGAKVALKNYLTTHDDWDKFNYMTDTIKERFILARKAREEKQHANSR